MHPFADGCGDRYAYALVDDDKVLLMSSSNKSRNILQCDLIQTEGQRKLLEQQQINLGEYLDNNHKLGLVLKDGNVSYFTAFSTSSLSQEVFTVGRVLLIQSTYSGGKLEHKTIWVDVPSWECSVFALKSAIAQKTVHFYVIGWDKQALQSLTVQVDVI